MSLQTKKNKVITYNLCSLDTADLYIAGHDGIVTDIGFKMEYFPMDWVYDKGAFCDACNQLRAFFDGNIKNLDIDFEILGTGFKREVLNQISRIPYGETRSYKEIAIMAGSPNAARAVGNVCRSNRILLAIPCHRVVATNGIGGYGDHIDIKRFLLELEKENK
jgi:methylated-DNA-[protein]-cysteine S-methyltransferase